MIKIIIADDHSMLREGFKTLLRKEADIQIIGEAASGKEAVRLVAENSPDVVIMDIQMPDMDGIQATKQVRTSHPGTGVIALSMHMENSMVIAMLKAGARGYLTKNTTKEELTEALHAVHRGGSYFCNETSLPLAGLIDKHSFNPYRNEKPVELTNKEKDIIRLICQEYSSKQIAPKLQLTKRTVDSYRKNIQEKIGAQNVVGIVLYGIKHGLFSLEQTKL